MLFNSIQFLLFFPIVTIIYFLLPFKFRWIHLLLASCYFYMAFVPVYILILFFTIVIDYYAGIWIEEAPEEKKRRFLVMSVVANVGILAFFKYFNFFIDNVNGLLGMAHSQTQLPFLNIILPIGLSFHTFQAMSYTLEVYRENQKAERNFGIYALYVMFYPQLVAGPIERPQNILHQFHEHKPLDYNNIAKGIRIMLWGFLKKVVVADRLGLITDPIFKDPGSVSGIGVLIGAIAFTFQIYADFSGYSDIALGSAKVMGFDLMRNFNRPFTATSVSEFWRKWHISLSTWFFDYVFNPVVAALRRWKKWAVAFGLMLTFTLSGFWHGAAWNFVIYGLLHGLVVTYEFFTLDLRTRIFGAMPKRAARTLGIIFTFSFVTLNLVLFRVGSMREARVFFGMFRNIPSELAKIASSGKINFLNLPNYKTLLMPGLVAVVAMEVLEFVADKYNLPETFDKKPATLRWAVYYTSLILLLFWGVYERHSFIYFQF